MNFAEGELYSMGNIRSRVSSPSSENHTPRFVKVDLGKVIEAVACGDSHGLLLTREKVRLFIISLYSPNCWHLYVLRVVERDCHWPPI